MSTTANAYIDGTPEDLKFTEIKNRVILVGIG
jgi:hypothetical protein